MIEQLPELVNADAALVRRGRFVDLTFLVGIGEEGWRIRVESGRIASVERQVSPMVGHRFALRAPAAEWDLFWQQIPPPGSQDIFGLLKRRVMQAEGDLQALWSNMMYFKDVLAAPRRRSRAAVHERSTPHIEPIVGRYVHLDIEGRAHRVYFEEAGQGIPLLCLHTAGSDGRQYRALMNDAEITRHFRVVAYDMPWHGKSSPPAGWRDEEYRLTSDGYVAQIVAVADALGLDRPVAMGCSIGGRIVLYLAHRRPDRFRCVIGLQSAAYTDPYYDLQWLHRPDVHNAEACGGAVSGLIGPHSPDKERWETVWHYMQSGPGVFKGDLFFYTADGDMRGKLHEIDNKRCPVHLLTGEYDYSATPDATREVARAIGTEPTIMKGLGHFPMSEDPQTFLTHLRPVLEKIRAAG